MDAESTQAKKVLVLINDSDIILAKVCRNKFTKEKGWEVFISINYDKALGIIKKNKPDLLITEIIINDNKGRTGFDLLREISTSEKYKDIKVIVFSDLSQEIDRKKAMDLGATRYFVKTDVSINEVIDEVGKLL